MEGPGWSNQLRKSILFRRRDLSLFAGQPSLSIGGTQHLRALGHLQSETILLVRAMAGLMGFFEL